MKMKNNKNLTKTRFSHIELDFVSVRTYENGSFEESHHFRVHNIDRFMCERI